MLKKAYATALVVPQGALCATGVALGGVQFIFQSAADTCGHLKAGCNSGEAYFKGLRSTLDAEFDIAIRAASAELEEVRAFGKINLADPKTSSQTAARVVAVAGQLLNNNLQLAAAVEKLNDGLQAAGSDLKAAKTRLELSEANRKQLNAVLLQKEADLAAIKGTKMSKSTKVLFEQLDARPVIQTDTPQTQTVDMPESDDDGTHPQEVF